MLLAVLAGCSEADEKSDGGTPPSSCESADCLGQNRVCGGDGSVDCGDCMTGFVEVGGVCTATSCDACTVQHRTCDESAVTCGDCLDDHFEQEGVCLPLIGCEDLDCASQNRECVQAPQSYCDTACTGDLVWDEGTESCREKLGCDVVAATCVGDQFCVEGAPDEDDTCVVECAAGLAIATETAGGPGCFTCGNAELTAAACAEATGTTGRVVSVDGVDGGRCVCETLTGYFPMPDGLPRECDADGDGWVNVDAVEFSESGAAGEREQARCEVRRITSIRLEGDDPFHPDPVTIDLVAESPTSTGGLGAALPLYERPENDRVDQAASSQDPVPIGTGGSVALAPAVLNSLTKACVIGNNDFNLNGLADRIERQLDRPGEAQLDGLPSVAIPWFGQYTRFSYFIELAEGWFEGPDTYVIAERPRDPRHSPDEERVALVRVGESLISSGSETQPTGSRYWRACGRHDDEIGGDFSHAHLETTASNQPAMFHHSQFRCVYPLPGSGAYDLVLHAGNAPAAVFWTSETTSGASLSWREREGETPVAFAEANTCWPMGSTYRRAEASVAGANPASHGFSCAPSVDRSTNPLQTNQLVWAIVGYQSYRDVPAEIGSQDPTPYEYIRGCQNECAEFGVDFCPTWDPDAPSPSLVCDGDEPGQHGQILCF